MPAYNAEKYIDEAITSILNQTFTNFEFIIRDDCSTDDTWKIIKKYGKLDKRIIVRKNLKNLDIGANRNELIKESRGKYIAWQDADDVSLPDRLKQQYSFLEKHKKVGIVGGYLQFFNDSGDISIRKYAANDASLRKNIFRYSPVAQPVAMLRMQALNKAGVYNPAYPPAEDIDMSFRIGENYLFANIPRILLKYRITSASATAQRLRKIELITLLVRWKNRHNTMYMASLFDYIYNILQFVSIFLISQKIKIFLFNKMRNSSI